MDLCFHGSTARSGPESPNYRDITITLRPPQSVGLLWTSDKSDAERPLPDNTQYSQETSMPPAGFELTIPTSTRPNIHAIDRAATGIDRISWIWKDNIKMGRRKVVKMGDERAGLKDHSNCSVAVGCVGPLSDTP